MAEHVCLRQGFGSSDSDEWSGDERGSPADCFISSAQTWRIPRCANAMCIAFYTLSSHPAYSLILATNRDEFLRRPTLPAHWHGAGQNHQEGDILSGIDVTGGGTWFGIERKTGKFGILTNVREEASTTQATSRGRLVSDWLESSPRVSIEDHLNKLQESMTDYAGFNILIGQVSPPSGNVELGFLSNRSEHIGQAFGGGSLHENLQCVRQLQDGNPCGVMSNGALACAIDGSAVKDLETAWPKMQTGNAAFQKAVSRHAEGESPEGLVGDLLAVLKWGIPRVCTTPSANYLLSIAPLPIKDKEDVRSTILVTPFDILPDQKAWYATRAQSVLLVERSTGMCHFTERQAYKLADGEPSWDGQQRDWHFAIA